MAVTASSDGRIPRHHDGLRCRESFADRFQNLQDLPGGACLDRTGPPENF